MRRHNRNVSLSLSLSATCHCFFSLVIARLMSHCALWCFWTRCLLLKCTQSVFPGLSDLSIRIQYDSYWSKMDCLSHLLDSARLLHIVKITKVEFSISQRRPLSPASASGHQIARCCRQFGLQDVLDPQSAVHLHFVARLDVCLAPKTNRGKPSDMMLAKLSHSAVKGSTTRMIPEYHVHPHDNHRQSTATLQV